MELSEPYLLFRRLNGGRIKVAAPVVAVLLRYVQHQKTDMEAGGVLMGRYLHGGDIVIDAATEPMSGDRRTRYSFYRAKEQHQAALDAAWQASKGTCTYLGEWHTHPQICPVPSGIDWDDWQRRLREDVYFDELLFLVVGTKTVEAWAGKGLQLPRKALSHLPAFS